MEKAFDQALERFPQFNHEPYYRDYSLTDLNALFGEFGVSSWTATPPSRGCPSAARSRSATSIPARTAVPPRRRKPPRRRRWSSPWWWRTPTKPRRRGDARATGGANGTFFILLYVKHPRWPHHSTSSSTDRHRRPSLRRGRGHLLWMSSMPPPPPRSRRRGRFGAARGREPAGRGPRRDKTNDEARAPRRVAVPRILRRPLREALRAAPKHPPLINRGYHARVATVRAVLDAFLDATFDADRAECAATSPGERPSRGRP